MKLHPEIAGRSCDDCKQWQYSDAAKVGGPRIMRAGKPLRRPPGQPPPCRRCPKIGKDVAPRPWNAVEWSDKSWQAHRFHQRCKATGRFPDDLIVARNAGLIESALADIRDAWQQAEVELLSQFCQAGIIKR